MKFPERATLQNLGLPAEGESEISPTNVDRRPPLHVNRVWLMVACDNVSLQLVIKTHHLNLHVRLLHVFLIYSENRTAGLMEEKDPKYTQLVAKTTMPAF